MDYMYIMWYVQSLVVKPAQIGKNYFCQTGRYS